MSTTTLTTKGQLTLPKDIRDRLGLKAGDRFDCSVSADGDVMLHRKSRTLADIVGILHAPGKSATVEDMNESIEDAVVERVMSPLDRA